MKKGELVALLEAVTVEELKSAIPLKEKIERLEKKRRSLEKELASVVKQIESLGIPGTAESSAPSVRKGKRRRIAQPSLSSLVVEIMNEKRKALTINDICSALLEEKGYLTQAKDFKAQVRVMMYRNDKGLFKKPKPGLFTLAADAKPKRKTKKKAAKKAKRKTKKKTTGKTAAARKKTAKRKTKTKKKTKR
jgi:uncharacterized protein (UPF0335 family)